MSKYREMTTSDKVKQFNELISSALCPLIDSDYIYLDIPLHQNIGDLLIWEGTEVFLSKLIYKCLYKGAVDTFTYPDIDTNVIILLHGGGNFGDIWERHQEFRLSVVRHYPHNKIIILPQTVYYANEKKMRSDCQVFNSHAHLTICVRDTYSFDLLRSSGLSTRLLLLPDMAFCIPCQVLQRMASEAVLKETLFVKRKDQELSKCYNYAIRIRCIGNLRVRDWPTYEKEEDPVLTKFWRLKKIGDNERWINYAQNEFRPYYVKVGCKFVSQYSKVYTTRLHVAVLCVLLGKDVWVFDNSYGKNWHFYQTWLKDCKGVKFVGKSMFLEKLKFKILKLWTRN